MFGTIRKHQTWLWVVIITLTIISFVVFFSPYSKMQEGGAPNYGSINGRKVTPDDFAKARREILLRYFFMNGNWPNQDAQRRGFDEMRESYQWMMLMRKQEEMGIVVSDDAAAQAGRDMLRNFERQGLSKPDAFAKQVLQAQGFTLHDFERFVKHFMGLQEMISLAGSVGKLVTPQEARELYMRENQPILTEVALFNASNYLAKVTVTPAAVAQFYTNYMANYRVPDRIQVAYVKFSVSNYLALAEAELSRSNLTEIIEANLQRMGTNYFGGAKTPDEAKAKLRQEIIRSRALAEARRKANDFARPIFDLSQPSVAEMEKAAKAASLDFAITKPFDRQEGPSELEAGEDFIKSAFARTAEDPFALPYTGMDGVYVYGLHKSIPSQVPSLESIRAKVEDDYKMTQAASLARQAGSTFHAAATNGLAQGKSFAELCKSADVTPIQAPEFAISTRGIEGDLDERVPLNLLKQLAFSTDAGKVSPFQPTRDGGVILFVKSKLPVSEEKMKQDLEGFTSYLRRSRMDEAFQSWFRKEAEKGLRDTPLAQDPAQRKGKS
jgi:hypothetical protein